MNGWFLTVLGWIKFIRHSATKQNLKVGRAVK